MSNDFLVFRLGQQRFALPVRQVSTVVPRPGLTPLSGAPADLIGVLRLRGGLFPVLDIRARLGLPVTAPHTSDCIVLMHTSTSRVGLLVEGVEGLVPTAPNPLEMTTLNADLVVDSDMRAYLAAITIEPRAA